MNAIEIKDIIDSKLKDIEKSIAFFCGKKYLNIIHERMKNLRYFIFESNQREELEDIELEDIAIAFSKDITYGLDIPHQRKKELEKILGKIIYEASKLDECKDYISNSINEIDELSNNDKYIKEISNIVEIYKKDYEVNTIYKNREIHKKNKDYIEQTVKELKIRAFKEIFGIDLGDNVTKIWPLLSAFNDENTMLDNQKRVNMKEEFYRLLGFKGSNLSQLEKDARSKNVVIEDYNVLVVKSRFETYFNEEIFNIFKWETNINDIENELNDLNMGFNIKNVISYIYNNPEVLAYNTFAYDENNDQFKIIIFINNENLYHKDFTTTFIHELLHYIGGYNKTKFGLHFYKNEKTEHIEEAYVCYLSNKIAREYIGEHGYILEPRKFKDNTYYYDCTTEYFDEVFRMYGDKLINYHFSSNIGYESVKKEIPLDEIADALDNIVNCVEKDDIRDIVKKEIKKLQKRNVR